MDPPQPVTRFSGGRGTLCINKVNGRPNAPDFLGSAKVRGKSYLIRGWLSADQESVNITLDPQ